ncbi:MAG TPA: PAS domain S-box protein, partial [Acidimicrobiales bacterium]|nr:PAS domain S-box protein [Acidimicrobiales bacterium]
MTGLLAATALAVVELRQVSELGAREEAVDEALDRVEAALIGSGADHDPDAAGPAAGELADELTEAATGLAPHVDLVGDDVVAMVLGTAAAGRADAGTDDRPFLEAVLDAWLAISWAEEALDTGLQADLQRAMRVANAAVAVALVGWVTAAVVWARRRARRKRLRLEAFYEGILDELPDRVHLYRADDLRLEFCNRAWAASHGRSPHDLVGERLDELLRDEEMAGLRAQLPGLREGVSTRGSIARSEAPDGSTVVTSWDDRPVELGDGTPLVLSVGRDVTALVAAEAEARFVAENAADVLMRVGLDRRIRFVTSSVATLLELAPADVIGAPLTTLIAASHHALLDDAIDAAVRTGGVERREVEALAAAATARVWCELEVGAVVAGYGRDIELHVALRDVSEQRRLTAELRSGRATLAAIVDAVPSGVVAIDRDGAILAVNRAATDLARLRPGPGASLGDLDGSTLQLLGRDGSPLDAGDLPLTQALLSGEQVTMEGLIRHRDTGDEVPVVATSQAWRDDRGDIAGAVAVVPDGTEGRAAERQLRAILDAIRHGVMLHDQTGRVVAANTAAADLLGVPDAATLVGLATDTALSDMVSVDGSPVGSGFTPVSDVVTHQRPVDAVEVGVGPEPDRRWLRVSAEPVATDLGHGAVVSLTDVTAEHHARAELAESEGRHRAVVENLHEGLVVQTTNGEIVSANAAAEHILGLTSDQLAGRTSIDPRWRTLDGDGRPLPGDAHPAMVTLRTGMPVDGFIMGVHRPDAELRWIEVTARPIPLPSGPGVFTVFHDLTDTLAAQAALVESEERFRSLADAAPVPVFTTDASGGIDYANTALRELMRVPLRRLVGLGWLDFLLDDERDELVATVFHAAQQAVEVRREHHVVPVDGERRFVVTTLRPIDGGRRLIGTIVDLTERRALEARLAHDATHDPLTGLVNRALFLDRLASSLHRSGRTGALPSVMFVDLDRFKPVNDAYGHAAGDHVLATIAQRLAGDVRDGDTVARLGGDEFVVLAEPPNSRHEADVLALRLLDRIMTPITLPDGIVVAVG